MDTFHINSTTKPLRRGAWYILGALLFLDGVAWYAVAAEAPRGTVIVSFLDVGQGDAIFIDSPRHGQVLIDGGSGSGAVLSALSGVMPFYDRFIDVVIATHPDEDHIGGLVGVLGHYRVGVVLLSGGTADTAVERAFREEILSRGVRTIIARRGMKVLLDGSTSLAILFPDRDVSTVPTNEGSIIARLVYGDTSYLFTGDAPQSIERYLAALDGEGIASDVLKVGHHGSKTSTDEVFLGAVDPMYAVISAGNDNRYGHPHEEVIDRLTRFGAAILKTSERGTIVIESNGERVRVR